MYVAEGPEQLSFEAGDIVLLHTNKVWVSRWIKQEMPLAGPPPQQVRDDVGVRGIPQVRESLQQMLAGSGSDFHVFIFTVFNGSTFLTPVGVLEHWLVLALLLVCAFWTIR